MYMYMLKYGNVSFFTEAMISFEHALYTISEGEAYIYSFFVVLENFATTIIQAPVTIVVEAVINMNISNATLGKKSSGNCRRICHKNRMCYG